ncbi:condensin complex subunit 2, partial [Elysia marginata]
MTELVKKKELESFQVASSTLDASVKIYAGRVDHIHTHTYKVLSGLGGGKTGNDAEPEGADGEEETGEAALKTKKKKKGKAHTIETNLKNINIDKFDLEFEVDPMFQMMSTAFDEGGARGLLLNRLHCFDSSQQLVLDSSTVVNVVEDSLPDSQTSKKPVPVSDLKDMLSSLSLEDKMICPSMVDFHFGDEDGNISSTSGDSSNVGTGDMRTAEFIESAISDFTDGSVGKLRQILALEPSDYSYFNKVLMRTWAGPAHWKVAPASRIGIPKDPNDNSKKKRQRKVPMRLSYDISNQTINKMFQISKHTTVTPATWSKYTKKKTTFPMDKQFDTEERLFRLFEKPKLMIKRSAGDSIGVDDDIENYDYNNKNDVENYCPVARDTDDNDDYSEGFDLSNETNFPQASQDLSGNSNLSESGLNGTSITQDKLVAAPHR